MQFMSRHVVVYTWSPSYSEQLIDYNYVVVQQSIVVQLCNLLPLRMLYNPQISNEYPLSKHNTTFCLHSGNIILTFTCR